MRRDLIIGILFSISVHGGVAWLGEVFGHKPKVVAQQEELQTVQLMEMPKLDDPPEEQVTTDEEQQSAPVEFAPPMQTDVPQIVTETSFVQQIQPPPPEGLKPGNAVMTIPTTRPTGLGKGIEVFDINKLDQQPQAKFRSKPVYPFDMRRAGISGEVLVEFICDTEGNVINPFVVRSSQREFEAAAVQAVSKWKFRPGKKGGRTVNTRMHQLISFTLNEE